MSERELDAALGVTLGQIDRLVARTRGESTGPLKPDELDPAELHALLEEAQGGEPLSFDIGDRPLREQGRLSEAQRALEALVQRVEDDLSVFAPVRTGPEDHPLLITTAGWDGDVVTLAAPELPSQALAEHALALRRRAQRRAQRLRLLVTTATAAVKLATALSGPGAALLALPIAFHFLRSTLSQMCLQIEL